METNIKNNLTEKYSKAIIIIHWLSFLLIMVLIPLGFLMTNTENGALKLILLNAHVFIGLLVFILTLLRAWFFFKHKRPSRLQTGKWLHNKLIVWIENSFYFILVLLSTSGIATVIFGNFAEAMSKNDILLLSQTIDTSSGMAHKALAIILAILLMGHVGGVISHYIKTKENTLKRIIP